MKTYFEDLISRLKNIDATLEEYSLDDEADAHKIALDLRKSLNDAIDVWSSSILNSVEDDLEVDAVTVKDFGGEVLL